MSGGSSSVKSEEREILSWTVHLAKAHPTKLVVTAALICASSVAAWFVIGPAGSLAVFMALMGSVADFAFPVKYRITSARAVCRTVLKTTEVEWSRVKKCFLDESGIKLSTVGGNSRLEAFRGVYLRFNGNREQVIEAVRFAREQCP